MSISLSHLEQRIQDLEKRVVKLENRNVKQLYREHNVGKSFAAKRKFWEKFLGILHITHTKTNKDWVKTVEFHYQNSDIMREETATVEEL